MPHHHQQRQDYLQQQQPQEEYRLQQQQQEIHDELLSFTAGQIADLCHFQRKYHQQQEGRHYLYLNHLPTASETRSSRSHSFQPLDSTSLPAATAAATATQPPPEVIERRLQFLYEQLDRL